MLSTKFLISNITEVPDTWIFETYCKLDVKLTGQEVMIKSLFNPTEKIASFSVYFKDGKYKFKDFSTGYGGDSISLVMKLFEIEYYAAVEMIINGYNDYVLQNGDYGIGEFKKHTKYKVTETCKRQWNVMDRDYWMSFDISSSVLEHYKVYPLSFYKMEKVDEYETKELNISGQYIYGYFKNDGTLYKIYQPKVQDKRFLKICNYIQGSEQLKFEQPFLLINKSMKDIVCFDGFHWPFESVAPDSENTLIPREMISAWKHKYRLIITMMDNDDAGIRAMQRYKQVYGLPFIHLKMSKDLSDSVKDHTREKVKGELYQLLKNVIFEKYEKQPR